jgi:hypothetical protein
MADNITTDYIKKLFDLYKKIKENNDDEISIQEIINLCHFNNNDLEKRFKKDDKLFVIDNNDIKINRVEYKESDHGLDILFNKKTFEFNPTIPIINLHINFVLFIKEIFDLNNDAKVEDFKNKTFIEVNIEDLLLETNKKILEKNIRLYNGKDKPPNTKVKKIGDFLPEDKLTKLQNLETLKINKDDIAYKKIIDDFILNINKRIQSVNKEIEDLLNKIDNYKNIKIDNNIIIKYFNQFINHFNKSFKKILNEKISDNIYIKFLFDNFKKSINDFKFPPLKEVIFDSSKYENFKTMFMNKQVENLNEKDIKALLQYEDLFNTNNGEWINDSKVDENIKLYKDKYDDLLAENEPNKIEVKKDNELLYNYSEKIKLIKEKLDNKEKIQQTEYDFIDQFDNLIEKIESENPDDIKQIELVKKAFEKSKINEKIKQEKEDKRILKDKIDEKDKDPETIYFEDYLTFFKFPLKIFTYGGIFFAFIILFLSFLSLVILIYDVIKNIITLFVNSANSTNNLSIDYISKSIINCSKDNYKDDRFYILTVQKQNLTIFNLGAYTLYLLILYLITYFVLIFYSNTMKYVFVGSVYDIDNNFVYLFIILFLIAYSFIHLLIFKFVFKPYVYIPYKTIDEEEIKIDKMIANFIIVKTETGQIIKFNDFFELLYDASKIDELSNYFLREIKNEDSEGCLEQKLIIYNLYEYLRQYVYFDEDFKYNFKLYCSTDEENKPLYDNGERVTFISMLKKDEIKIISNFHEELNFINNLEDNNIEFYNKLNIEVSNKIKEINTIIITHNKTSLPFFITIIYIVIIFLFNFIFIYLIIKQIQNDKTEAFHKYIIYVAEFLDTNIYKNILKYFNLKL